MDNVVLHISFFERILYPVYSNARLQAYYGLVLYLFLAMALCGLLATIAYLFSLSSVQDSEKRSEYECGFEPFDSATRLPFDVHFYLVGILFLIFDVEIALLFPWVLSLRTTGWFGFYLMVGFILLLAVGFLYEWKRGALIWPSRQAEQPYNISTAKAYKNLNKKVTFNNYVKSDSLSLKEKQCLIDKNWPKSVVVQAFPTSFKDGKWVNDNTTQLSVSENRKSKSTSFFNRILNNKTLSESLRRELLSRANKKNHVVSALFALFFNSVVVAAGEPQYKTAAVIPNTAYINIPTTIIERKIAFGLKKVTMRVNRAVEKVNAWKYKKVSDYIAALRFIGKRLNLHRKATNFYLNKIAILGTFMRSRCFHDEPKILRMEARTYKMVAITRFNYHRALTTYRSITRALTRQQVSLKKIANKRAAAVALIRKYSFLKLQSAVRPTKALRLQKTVLSNKLRRHFPQQYFKNKHSSHNNMYQRRLSKFSPHRGGFQMSQSSKIAFIPVPLITEIDSYALQFIGGFLPEIILTLMLTLTLLFLAIELGQGRSKKLLAMESLAALRRGFTFVILLYIIQLIFGSTAALFNGYLLVTEYTTALKLLTAVSGQFILNCSEKYVKDHSRHLLEYPVILTLAVLFMLLLVGSGHLISAFLAIVGFSLNLYVLVLFDATSAVAREAGIKYFYLSTISSGLILYGVFLLFIIAGTGHIYEIGHFLSTNTELLLVSGELLQLALALLLVGLFFKLSAFPGHLWAAEVYEGSPDPVTAFFMLPVKVAVLAFVVQLLAVAFEPLSSIWQPLVVVSASFSLVWGCLAALSELKTKRFLAYASINQIGFLLIGLSSGSMEGYRTTLFYLVLYAVMNIGFLIIFLHARRKGGQGLLYLTDFRGFGQRYTQYSWSVAMILLSMAGIPPLAGFFGKYYLLLHAQEQELYGLVIVGLAASLVSTYYYLRLIKIFWFEGGLAATPVDCELTWQQALLLRLVEWSLWIFIVYSGAVIYSLDALVESLLVLNDFYTQE